MLKELGISDELIAFGERIEETVEERFHQIDKIAAYNQWKVLYAMQKHHLQEGCFMESTGYGYNDLGRETLEKVYADVFHTEAALVRPQIACGTHALSIALFSVVRPGDEILSISGKPYDTLEEVIGIRESKNSLKEWGVSYRQVELTPEDTFDFEKIRLAIGPHTKLVTIQRSKGYLTRRTLSPAEIGEAVSFVKSVKSDVVVVVDNCYGEFVCEKEPSDYGADMVVGSLIKNPGGGLAVSGGYIVGTKECIKQCGYRLNGPGLGAEVGANFHTMRAYFQGLFLAPTVVASALKTAVFAAKAYESLGFPVSPASTDERFDIIQAVTLHSPEAVVRFCEGIQSSSPVDSFVVPEPWDMPGYDSQVIMAAGTFISGASIELSADGPMKPPYNVYFQGGLTYPHGKLGILKSIQYLVDSDVVKATDLC